MFVVEKARSFAVAEGRKLLILLSYSPDHVIGACKGVARFDSSLIDFLREGDYAYADSLDKHVEDFKSFGCSPETYVQRYYIGHYSPSGNHFFAFAVKDSIVEWLDPKPPTYQLDWGPSMETLNVDLG